MYTVLADDWEIETYVLMFMSACKHLSVFGTVDVNVMGTNSQPQSECVEDDEFPFLETGLVILVPCRVH